MYEGVLNEGDFSGRGTETIGGGSELGCGFDEGVEPGVFYMLVSGMLRGGLVWGYTWVGKPDVAYFVDEKIVDVVEVVSEIVV